MGYQQQQTQAFCAHCGEYRLHTRNLHPYPHLLSLAVTLITFGLWLPFWLLDYWLNACRHEPFRCSHCGQIAGTGGPPPMAPTKPSDQFGKRLGVALRGLGRSLHDFARRLPGHLKGMLHGIDSGLDLIASPENLIVWWFLRFLLCGLFAALATAAVCFLWK